MWELPAAGKPVKKALSPSRAMVHLDRLLVYHELTYVDAFIMEIPWIKGGEVRHVHTQQLLPLIVGRGGDVEACRLVRTWEFSAFFFCCIRKQAWGRVRQARSFEGIDAAAEWPLHAVDWTGR